jgi:hypothetical protein
MATISSIRIAGWVIMLRAFSRASVQRTLPWSSLTPGNSQSICVPQIEQD